MSDDLSDAFLYYMGDKAREAMKEEQAKINANHGDELGDRAVIKFMAQQRLKRGQMLVLGPDAVKMLMTPGVGGRAIPVHILDNKPGA